MNREILFKAKRKDNGEWVEDGYFSEPYTDKKFIICWNSFGLGFNEFIEIDPDTLCQYTGLTDKNGKEIWENDIISISSYSYYEPEDDYFGVVKYSSKDACWSLCGEASDIICECFGSYTTEIINHGNIFDNPELLEVERVEKYKCKKSFCVDKYDDDGFMIENAATVIEEGKIYELDETGYMIIGGSDHVHLDAVDEGSWLEIAKEHLKEFFELLEV